MLIFNSPDTGPVAFDPTLIVVYNQQYRIVRSALNHPNL
jgi:hypothetical protein